MSDGSVFHCDSDSFLPASHWTVVKETVHEDGSVTCEVAWIDPEPRVPIDPPVTIPWDEGR